jgi:hypothetical protein
MLRRMVRASVLVVVVAASACRAGPPPNPLEPLPVVELDSWRVVLGDVPIGRVALIEIADPVSPVRLYWVENASGQWLGYVDLQGRVYQRVPFRERERFLGMYSMENGLPLLFECEGPVRLVGVAEAALVERGRGDR